MTTRLASSAPELQRETLAKCAEAEDISTMNLVTTHALQTWLLLEMEISNDDVWNRSLASRTKFWTVLQRHLFLAMLVTAVSVLETV